MSRETSTTVRSTAVWLLVTAATTVAGAALPATWAAVGSPSGTAPVVDLLVATCATGLAAALTWLWCITTATVADLLRGRSVPPGATRRLVLLACGVAVAAGAAVPAQAADDDGRDLLVGLSLPERAVAPARVGTAGTHTDTHTHTHTHTHTDTGTYVVRPGDSLSSIALAHPGPGALEDRWRAIWWVNRDVVGDDPDLIHPGQALRLPGTPRTRQGQDGDRS